MVAVGEDEGESVDHEQPPEVTGGVYPSAEIVTHRSGSTAQARGIRAGRRASGRHPHAPAGLGEDAVEPVARGEQGAGRFRRQS
jgi:hypothetical protein